MPQISSSTNDFDVYGETYDRDYSDNTLASGSSAANYKKLFRRKGGGGHGGGHGGHSSGKGGGSGSKGSSAAAHKGASSSFVNSKYNVPVKLNAGSKTASPYSDGGGKPFILDKTTAFPGRRAGGGARSTVYGTSRFGSGYPYGGYGTYVGGRPFPYIYYPVPCDHDYYDGNEYLNTTSQQRPGGNLVAAIVQPAYNTSSVTYRIVGDNSSVNAVFQALVANCTIANSTSAVYAFTPGPSTWPRPEQVVQYYRASSFALSLDSYNNSAALPSNMPSLNTTAPLPLSDDTPLPAGLNMTFFQCVNKTVGASVPLQDPSGLTKADIIGIVVTSLSGLASVAAIIFLLIWKWIQVKKARMTALEESQRSVIESPSKESVV